MSVILKELNQVKKAALISWNKQIIENATTFQLITGEPLKEFKPGRRMPDVPAGFDPLQLGLFIGIKGKKFWLGVIDTDGEELDNAMLEMAYYIHDQEPPSRKPVIKASGKKGVQLYWPIRIESPRPTVTLRDWMYTKWVEYEIEDSFDIKFGRDREHPDASHWDLTMFQDSRMWRIFCTRMRGHYPNGRYSVPLTVGDTLDDAQRKMRLDLTLEYEASTYREPFVVREVDVKHRFDMKSYREGGLPISTTPTSDVLLKRLTPALRGIVGFEGNPPHDWRYALASYMYCYCGVHDPEEIVNFIMERCEWTNKEISTVRYQVQTAVKTCQDKWPEKPVPAFVWTSADGG